MQVKKSDGSFSSIITQPGGQKPSSCHAITVNSTPAFISTAHLILQASDLQESYLTRSQTIYKDKTPLASSMESRSMGIAVPLGMLMLMLLLGLSSSDFAQDRAECADQLVGLATCLPYVGGDARAPTPDCCSGLKQVLQKSLKCLCILVEDRNNPSLGLKVNNTLALSLTTSCHAPVNISQCIDLLHLAPNSTDAEAFDGFENSLEKRNSTKLPDAEGNSTDGTAGSSAQIKSNRSERSRKPWLATLTVISAALLQIFTGLHFYFISM